MKFTNGYWLVKKGIDPIYAAEYYGHEIHGKELIVYAASKHITSRGDCMNIGMITLHITSPMENIIRTEITHWEGGPEEGRVDIAEQDPEITIQETEEFLIYQSGTLRVVISKVPAQWKVSYYDGEKPLTFSGWRNQAQMQDHNTGTNYMVEQLSIDIGEQIYGLGERFTPFVKNGQHVEIWNEDGGTASEQTYKNIPFYLTSKGYGILVDTYGGVDFEIASEKVENVQFSVPGERLAYYVIGGHTPKDTISLYCKLTGMPALPPEWSFGLWLTTSFTTNYDEATTSSFIQGMADRHIPLSVFHYDCYWMRAWHWCDFIWDPDTFPDPEGMLARNHEKGLKICVWINPYIAQQSYLFREGKEHGYFVRKTDGSIWQTDLWQPGMALVDFTNPDAKQWYQGKLEALLDMGVDCFKTDFGERIPVTGIKWFDGSTSLYMHNHYTKLYNQAVFELLECKRGKGNAALFARSATVGSQSFPIHWGGDCSASYSSMAETLRGGLSLASSGFGFWSHDISGFEATATPDLYKRWCQFGLLSSHSRLHGSASYRVPWNFDEEACVVLREMTELKCSLMPYLYGKAVEAHTAGVPMQRPMFMEFPDDRTCLPLDTQYMLGDALLAAPIFNEAGQAEYYVPAGKWVNLFTNEVKEGGKWYRETFDYHTMPLLVRPNSILPMGSCKTRPDYNYTEDITLLLGDFSDGAEAAVTIPNEDGTRAMQISATCSGNTIRLSITGEGSFKARSLTGQNVEIEM